MTPLWFVTKLIAAIQKATQGNGHAKSYFGVATPVLRADKTALKAFRNDRKNGRSGATTVVFDHQHLALYFSKEIIPYFEESKLIPLFHHVGIYAFTYEVLQQYTAWPSSDLESLEGLEQLRFLERGIPIKCVEVNANGHLFWELNNPEDIGRIEAAMRHNARLNADGQ